LLGERDPLVLVKWLLEEIEARGETARGPVGFQLPSHAPSSRLEKTEQKAA
jgi:hypothetical protein